MNFKVTTIVFTLSLSAALASPTTRETAISATNKKRATADCGCGIAFDQCIGSQPDDAPADLACFASFLVCALECNLGLSLAPLDSLLPSGTTSLPTGGLSTGVPPSTGIIPDPLIPGLQIDGEPMPTTLTSKTS